MRSFCSGRTLHLCGVSQVAAGFWLFPWPVLSQMGRVVLCREQGLCPRCWYPGTQGECLHPSGGVGPLQDVGWGSPESCLRPSAPCPHPWAPPSRPLCTRPRVRVLWAWPLQEGHWSALSGCDGLLWAKPETGPAAVCVLWGGGGGLTCRWGPRRNSLWKRKG